MYQVSILSYKECMRVHLLNFNIAHLRVELPHCQFRVNVNVHNASNFENEIQYNEILDIKFSLCALVAIVLLSSQIRFA